MIPKAPYFDEARGSLTVHVGSDDYDKGELDYGAPFMLAKTMPSAFRVSLSVQNAGSYYDAVKNDFVSLYGALKVRINDNLRLFTGGEYFDFRSNENVGWNRPAQNLIDHGQYVLGEPLSVVRPGTGGIADRDLIGDFTAVPSNRRALFRALVVPAHLLDKAVEEGGITASQRDLLVNMSDPLVRGDVYARFCRRISCRRQVDTFTRPSIFFQVERYLPLRLTVARSCPTPMTLRFPVISSGLLTSKVSLQVLFPGSTNCSSKL